MSYLDWHVGMKVVCIGCEGTPKPPGFWGRWRKTWGISIPKRGCVYTLREMTVMSDGLLRVRLAEVRNPVITFAGGEVDEPWFIATAFRPVQPRETDISIFTAMLDTEHQREPEFIGDDLGVPFQ